MKRSVELWLSAAIAMLAVPVHLTGLLSPVIYRDPAFLLPQNLGTDLITLALGIPLLVTSAVFTGRGSRRGRLLWLGTLGFLAYDYGMYALGVRWNPLFLAYLALFSLSLYLLILGLVGTDAETMRASLVRPAPRRLVAAYLFVVVVLVAAVWLAEEVGATLTRSVPQSVRQLEAPTNIVHVFDLGIVFPAMVIAALQLLRDRAWGYVLTAVVLVKAGTIGLWVVVMMWFSARAGIAVPGPYALLFIGLTVTAALLAWRFLGAFGEGRGGVTHGTTPVSNLP